LVDRCKTTDQAIRKHYIIPDIFYSLMRWVTINPILNKDA
jgi:hypothetical protein